MPEQRYRALYLAEDAIAAYCETIAFFRPDLPAIAAIQAMGTGMHALASLVPTGWRVTHRLASTHLHPSLMFADLTAAESIQTLRQALAPIAVDLGLQDIDLSALTGPQRLFTQECARFVYEQVDGAGQPIYAGLRYVSRFDPGWLCWVAFSDRIRHRVVQVRVIGANDPDLGMAARVLRLGIEGLPDRSKGRQRAQHSQQ